MVGLCEVDISGDEGVSCLFNKIKYDTNFSAYSGVNTL